MNGEQAEVVRRDGWLLLERCANADVHLPDREYFQSKRQIAARRTETCGER